MMIRMYEYDSQLALRNMKISNDTLNINFPNSGILYLRNTRKTPNRMFTRIKTPGGEIKYPVRIIKMSDYSIDDIFKKELFFLIPFILFNYERHFELYNKDVEIRKELIEDFNYILDTLNNCLKFQIIDNYTYQIIIDSMKIVSDNLTKNYENVKKEVNDLMGGKPIEYEVIKVYKKGLNEGRSEGRNEGRIEVLNNLVRDGLISKKDASKYQKQFSKKQAKS